MQENRVQKHLFWQENKGRNKWAQMLRLQKSFSFPFFLPWICDPQALQTGIGHTLTHTHTNDDFPPGSLSSTVEHMSFVCHPSSALTERHLETLIYWSHPCSAPCNSQAGVSAHKQTEKHRHTWFKMYSHSEESKNWILSIACKRKFMHSTHMLTSR